MNTKKQSTILLILVFIFGLNPAAFALAITQNQISAEVQILCPDGYGNWFSGSGTVIDPKGIILTNKHVVSDENGAAINTCFVGFTDSIDQNPNFGPESDHNLAEVKYYTTTSDMDAAILYLNNPTNKVYPYVDIWDSNSSILKFGDKVEAMGFPSIGGSTITYSSGDFSGYGSISDGTKNYIKTTVPLEHGNSGGAAYNSRGQFIGIPSMVVAGTLNSLSYILSINSIKIWLSNTLGNKYKDTVKTQESVIEQPAATVTGNIAPPNFNSLDKLCYAHPFKYANVDSVDRGASCFPPKLGKKVKYHHVQFFISGNLVNNSTNDLKTIYYYFDKKPHNSIDDNALQYTPAKIFTDGVSITDWIDIKTPGKYFLSFFGENKQGSISDAYIYEYVYVLGDNSWVAIYPDETKETTIGWLGSDPETVQTISSPTFQINNPDEADVDGYYVYFGTNKKANPAKHGTLIKKSEFTPPAIIKKGVYYFIFRAKNKDGVINETVITKYRYKK